VCVCVCVWGTYSQHLLGVDKHAGKVRRGHRDSVANGETSSIEEERWSILYGVHCRGGWASSSVCWDVATESTETGPSLPHTSEEENIETTTKTENESDESGMNTFR